MSYLDPNLVNSPKHAVADLEVLHDGGEQEVYDQGIEAWKVGWSLAKMKWYGNPAYAMRWNGGTEIGAPLGNPQSRGIATWFILPDKVGKSVVRMLNSKRS